MGSTKGKALISLKHIQIFLKQFAKRMGQLNFNAVNNWKKVWVAWFVEKKHQSMI